MASLEHQKLSSSIKEVHRQLRESVANGEDPDKVWNVHVNKGDVLQAYSSCMRDLATVHWTVLSNQDGSTCRISWIYDQINGYFRGEGFLEQLKRDAKRARKYGDAMQDFSYSEEKGFHSENKTIDVLDVGSCYNPFDKFELLNVTPIDIAPANSEVMKCDFLTVPLSEDGHTVTVSDKTVTCLPRGGFSVVIFSFLLEYLPTARQRYECCKKACEVLENNGLLLIVTPDSSHETKNSQQMKSWRIALGLLGLAKVSYEKTKHFHGLSFRKVGEKQKNFLISDAVKKLRTDIDVTDEFIAELVYIPQDFNEVEEKLNEDIELTEEERNRLRFNFTELPEL